MQVAAEAELPLCQLPSPTLSKFRRERQRRRACGRRSPATKMTFGGVRRWAQVTLSNRGNIDLLHSPERFPSFATLLSGPAGLREWARLPAGGTAVYALRLRAEQTPGPGTHSQIAVRPRGHRG